MCYDYNQCVYDIMGLTKTKRGFELFSIGDSVMGKKIYCLTYGRGFKKLFINGAHHGLEYITSAFLMRFLKDFSDCIEGGLDMLGFNTHKLYSNVQLYCVPMVNPDGVDIAIHGLDITNRYHRRLISLAGIHSFNKVWQANANGVDINHNYDALWSRIESLPSPSKYSGPYAESEPETKAVCDLVRNEGFDMLMAFHSQGGEIYYDFNSTARDADKRIAEKMAVTSGYTVATPTGTAAYGGLKDWFIKEYKKSGFTVEMGHGKNPLSLKLLDDFYEENAKILLCAMNELSGIKNE